MDDLAQIQAELTADLTGENGEVPKVRAILDMHQLAVNSEMGRLLVKGSGDIGVKAIGDDITISD